MRIISYYETKESNSINDANNNYVLRFHKELNYSTNWYYLYRIVEFNTKKLLSTKLARYFPTSNVVNILSLHSERVDGTTMTRDIQRVRDHFHKLEKKRNPLSSFRLQV